MSTLKYDALTIFLYMCLQKKCEQYYGQEKGDVVCHAEFNIETTAVELYADFIIRTLQVTKAVRISNVNFIITPTH